MENEKITIQFDLMSPSFTRQLKSYKLKFDSEYVKIMEELKHGTSLLLFQNILTQKEYYKCSGRIYKKLIAHIKKRNKNLKSK